MPTATAPVAVALDMNLRLWSDTQKLDDLIPEFQRQPEYLHHRDEAVHLLASGRRHIPRRHYASFPASRATDMATIEPWLNGELDRLERCILTAELIRMGVVEAILWIAIFADAPVTPPALGASIVARLHTARARVLIENYAPSSPAAPGTQTECPTKTWYPPGEASPTNPSHTP